MLTAEVPFSRGRRLMQQVALLDLPEKRMQESGEALGETIKQLNQKEVTAALPMLRDANVGIPEVLPSTQAGTLYIMMDGGRLNTTTEGWREPKVATLFWGEDVAEVSKERAQDPSARFPFYPEKPKCKDGIPSFSGEEEATKTRWNERDLAFLKTRNAPNMLHSKKKWTYGPGYEMIKR